MDNNLEDTKGLNELENKVNNIENNEGKLDETIVFDPISENESQEELYNNLVGSEDTKEFNSDESVINSDEEKEKEEDNFFNDKNDKKNKLPKKKKIIIIVSIVLFIIIIGIVLFLIFKPKEVVNEDISDVVVQKDNYIYRNGKLILLDENEKSIGEYECKNKDADLCYVAYLDNANDSFISGKNTYEDGSLLKSRAPIYLNKYVFIVDHESKNNDSIVLYDILDNNVVDEYKSVKAYNTSSDYVVIEDKNSLFGLFEIEDAGLKEIIPFKYLYLGINKGDKNKIVAKDDKGYMILNNTGNAISKYIPYPIVDFNDYLIVASKSGKYGIYDYDGKEYQSDLDFIKLIDKTYFAYVDKKQLYIKDTDNNKYHEEGYELNNDNYIPTNIYDKDNKKIKTQEAFNIELNGTVINIKIDNNTSLLNLMDGEASKNYKYYSYFAGKLYFYSDENKTKLIGTYVCNNKNENIKNNTLENCYVAKDSCFSNNYKTLHIDKNSTIPMFNNKYVFIYDGPTLANEDNMEIKFYDLSQNKVLGTYSAIDADIADNDGKFDLLSTSNKEIIARTKGKDGRFGTIIISNDSAKVNYKFEYQALERYGKYFIGQKEDDDWVVIYSDKETSNSFEGKIMNDITIDKKEYFVIKEDDDDDVMIYPNEKNAKPLIDQEFSYIVLDEKLYAAVDSNNRLWLYRYDNNKPLNDKGIKLDDKEYYSSDVDNYPFTLKYSKSKVEVLSWNGKKYESEDEFDLNPNKED